MGASTFKVRTGIPKTVRIGTSNLNREQLYEWLWRELADIGLLGVHEGTLLSEAAVSFGLETEFWTVDSGEAPRERDWVANQELQSAELYFGERAHAEEAARRIKKIGTIHVEGIEEQKAQDWDAEWKASFQGIFVDPFWQVIPPWVEPKPGCSGKVVRVNPGAGFGTGTHETTQLCLLGLGELSQKTSLLGLHCLDFGSGSGILGIAAASLGAQVDAVEIDPLAIDNARENAALNFSVEENTPIRFARELGKVHRASYSLIFANILKPVLLQFAGELTSRLDKKGTLILSGLIEGDVKPVTEAYAPLMGGKLPQVKSLNEWRALIWMA